MAEKKLKPVHPGEILLEEFLKPLGLSQNRLALSIGVPPRRINEIVLGKRSISADTALRLGRYFDMSPQFWLGLQMDYDRTWPPTRWIAGWSGKSSRAPWPPEYQPPPTCERVPSHATDAIQTDANH